MKSTWKASDVPAQHVSATTMGIETCMGTSKGIHGSVQPDVDNAPWLLYGSLQRWRFSAVLFAVSACNYFDYSVLTVVLDPIKHEFHVSDMMLGLLTGFCFSLIYAISGLPIARWADRGNRRTVISIALVVWSSATVLCGVAQSFWQLALARFGLGVAEPGALPPSQSLIADYFPPSKRAAPIAVLIQGGGAVGWLAGVAVGGYIAARYGWRMAFILAGICGLTLALLVRVCLPEPRTIIGLRLASAAGESIAQTFAKLRAKPSFLFICLGAGSYAIFSFGFSIFLPSFMMRSLAASLAELSVLWGLTTAAANLSGGLLGGMIADRLSKRDTRWYAWMPAITCVTALPLYWIALRQQSVDAFVLCDFFGDLVATIGVPSIYAGCHAVCGERRRAVAIATLQLCYTVLGSGVGPLIAGWLSDVVRAQYGAESLRHSLLLLLVFLVPAAAAYYKAAWTMSRDAEG